MTSGNGETLAGTTEAIRALPQGTNEAELAIGALDSPSASHVAGNPCAVGDG